MSQIRTIFSLKFSEKQQKLAYSQLWLVGFNPLEYSEYRQNFKPCYSQCQKNAVTIFGSYPINGYGTYFTRQRRKAAHKLGNP